MIFNRSLIYSSHKNTQLNIIFLILISIFNNRTHPIIKGLLAKIPNIPIDKRRDEARINVLKYFGYYYFESTFACEESWFFNHIKHQKTSSIIGNINTLIFETIKKCIHRFSQNNIIEYCIQCIQSKNAVLIQKCVSLTYDIDFASANMEWQEKFKLVLIDNVTTNALWSAITLNILIYHKRLRLVSSTIALKNHFLY